MKCVQGSIQPTYYVQLLPTLAVFVLVATLMAHGVSVEHTAENWVSILVVSSRRVGYKVHA